MPESRRSDQELLRLAGITRRELESYDEELLAAWRSAELDEQTLWRIRRVHRLRRQLGLNYEAIEIIVRLVDRLEQLESVRSHHEITVRVLDK
jgi:hypothetical protein